MSKIIIFLCFVLTVSASERGERLVLHSDNDIAQELANLRTELNEQRQEINSLKQSLITSSSPGSTYIRWGRKGCPGNGSTLIYSGFMAGSRREAGGSTNYLCLTGEPLWDYYEDAVSGWNLLYGVEYEFTAHSSSSRSHFFGSDIYNDDAPCALCHTTRATSVMIPGRNECYGGMTKEYSGYLVTEDNRLNHATEYVCLDRRPEAVINGKQNHDENLIFLVEASCGQALECPPYINGRELTCVVCSL